MLNKLKKFITKTIAGVMASGIMLTMTPVIANAADEAKDSGSIGDVNVTVGDDGSLVVSGGGMSSTTTSGTAWTKIIQKYKNFIVGISGIGCVSMILFAVFNFMQLGAKSGNSSERQKCIVGLVFSGVAAAGLGSVTVIVGFFYSALK